MNVRELPRQVTADLNERQLKPFERWWLLAAPVVIIVVQLIFD